MRQTIQSLTVSQYQSHELHTGDYTWRQSNCFVDLWIEVLHTLGLNPVASFAFTLATDFEGDQWTFFKMPLQDLDTLYGIDVQELNIWHTMLEHLITQTQRGRLTLVEVDAFYLPDVGDTSYQQAHEKTTIGIAEIDQDEQFLGYFHNSGYYTLHGADFAGIFADRTLPLYVEFAKFDRLVQRSEAELAELALSLLKKYVQRAPRQNPFIAYGMHLDTAIPEIQDLEFFHKYAFATIRQFGSCYQYAALFLQWLAPYQGQKLQTIAEHFTAIGDTAQVLLLKTARAVKTRKPFAHQPLLLTIQEHWEQAMAELHTL